jgi:putative addiction module killer protein
MLEIRQTEEFERWLSRLRDAVGRAKILVRLRRLALGNPGDVKPVGGGVSELRIGHGRGYRVYFAQRGPMIILILCGGDKRTQQRDIKRAIAIVDELEDEADENQGIRRGCVSQK